MINKNIHFLLVPDSNARRKVLAKLVQLGNSIGVVVGTWGELLDWIANNYRIITSVEQWSDELRNIIADMPDAFWAKSYLVEPDATFKIIDNNIKDFISTTLFSNEEQHEQSTTLNLRASKVIADLRLVIERLDENIPDDLSVVRQVLSTSDKPPQNIRVYYEEGYPQLATWQSTFILNMNKKVGGTEIQSYRTLLVQERTSSSASKLTALGHMQRNLFTATDPVEIDQSIQYLGVRDYLQEMEVTAGIIQEKIKKDESLSFSDFSILIPQSDNYFHALKTVFSMTGIPLSGLPHVTYLRDIARETVLNFLECQQKPAPVMAIAELLTSSLMPWSKETGVDLAQQIMNGRYELKLPKSSSKLDKQALSLIFDLHDSPILLTNALENFKKIISISPASVSQIERANESIELLIRRLVGADLLNLGKLSALIKPEQIKDECTGELFKEGITICVESQETWRNCKHLLILGFNSRHYPSQAGFSPVFSDDDIGHLKSAETELQSRKDNNINYLNRFLRQLRSCTDSCTFLIPRLKADSSKLYPSETLVYMHSLLTGFDEPDSLILDLDRGTDLNQTHSVSILDDLPKLQSWLPQCDNIELNIDLLALSKNGELRALSPSRIEDLMVSPLAWLLSWLDLEPKGWKPDEPNPLILGSLAHGVFEDLFQPNKDLPEEEEISELVEDLLEQQLKKIAPFMLSSKWDIERHKLVDEIIKSAKAWRAILIGLDARIVDNEIWLKGEYVGVPIHGQADSILQLANGQLIVVDHKKAGVSNRQPRMEKGYDCQVSLYREMLKTGLPEPHEELSIENIEVLYYLMNGQVAISEKGISSNKSIPGWIEIDNDVSINAMELIQQRIKQIRRGTIKLNGISDEEFYTKEAGFTPYALDRSPLISLFIHKNTSEVEV